MPTSVAQNNNYNPRVLEEHGVPSDYDQKKQRTMIAIILVIVLILLGVWYFIAKQKEKTPEGVLERLRESSLPVNEDVQNTYAQGQLLGSTSTPTTTTSSDRLQMLNSFNQ
ncbi:MAG TPA: hypothetical protein VGE18_03090 [Candidatus Paceibacterota bacterium]